MVRSDGNSQRTERKAGVPDRGRVMKVIGVEFFLKADMASLSLLAPALYHDFAIFYL